MHLLCTLQSALSGLPDSLYLTACSQVHPVFDLKYLNPSLSLSRTTSSWLLYASKMPQSHVSFSQSSRNQSKSMMTLFSVAPVCHGHGGGCGVRSLTCRSGDSADIGRDRDCREHQPTLDTKSLTAMCPRELKLQYPTFSFQKEQPILFHTFLQCPSVENTFPLLFVRNNKNPILSAIVISSPPFTHRLGGLVVKASASRAEDPGFESRLRRDFSGSSHTSDLNIGNPVATLPGAWRYRVSAGTGRPGVSIL